MSASDGAVSAWILYPMAGGCAVIVAFGVWALARDLNGWLYWQRWEYRKRRDERREAKERARAAFHPWWERMIQRSPRTARKLSRLGITEHNRPQFDGEVTTFSFYPEPREQTEMRYGAFFGDSRVPDLGAGFATRKQAARVASAHGMNPKMSRADYGAALRDPR